MENQREINSKVVSYRNGLFLASVGLLKRVKELCPYYDHDYIMRTPICSLFVWDETKEGGKFWEDVAETQKFRVNNA